MNVPASPRAVKPSDEWPAWTDFVAFWPTDTPATAAESESFADDLRRAAYDAPAPDDADQSTMDVPDAPGTDGDYVVGPVGPDDDDARWAAENLFDPAGPNPGWVHGEPDGSSIDLTTTSARDRHLDDLAASSEAQDRLEAGCLL